MYIHSFAYLFVYLNLVYRVLPGFLSGLLCCRRLGAEVQVLVWSMTGIPARLVKTLKESLQENGMGAKRVLLRKHWKG